MRCCAIRSYPIIRLVNKTGKAVLQQYHPPISPLERVYSRPCAITSYSIIRLRSEKDTSRTGADSAGTENRLTRKPKVDALEKWLEIRGDAEYLTDHVFLYRHKPLSRRYCQVRLSTYGKRTGNHISPHQLRHSCAKMLLNAGAPIVTVQTLLGHKKIDSPMGYARLYDGTVATDYYRAMGQIERLFKVNPIDQVLAPNPAELIALLDSLSSGTLNEHQRQVLSKLCESILVLSNNIELQSFDEYMTKSAMAQEN